MHTEKRVGFMSFLDHQRGVLMAAFGNEKLSGLIPYTDADRRPLSPAEVALRREQEVIKAKQAGQMGGDFDDSDLALSRYSL
jgi:hypothetical protein